MSHISHINHINLLNSNIRSLLKRIDIEKNERIIRPTIFEYYSAIQLTLMYKKPFWVWKDISKDKKMKEKFPIIDKGIDICDETFTIIGQSKYYSPENYITYGKLSTFLATRVLVGRDDIKFNLIRTSDSKIHSALRPIIDRKDLTDICIDRDEFLSYCNKLKS